MDSIQVPTISSSTHPDDEGNDEISLYSDEVLPPSDDLFDVRLYSSDDDDDDSLDNYQYYNQRVARRDPDYDPNY